MRELLDRLPAEFREALLELFGRVDQDELIEAFSAGQRFKKVSQLTGWAKDFVRRFIAAVSGLGPAFV